MAWGSHLTSVSPGVISSFLNLNLLKLNCYYIPNFQPLSSPSKKSNREKAKSPFYLHLSENRFPFLVAINVTRFP